MTAHCAPTKGHVDPAIKDPIDGSYWYYREDGFHLVIVTKGQTYDFPVAKARLYRHMSSLMEAMKREETGSGFADA